MNKIKTFTILLALGLFGGQGMSQTIVSEDTAKLAAILFANKETPNRVTPYSVADISETQAVVEGVDTLLFIIHVGDYNVIVSRLKNFPPILGYSQSDGAALTYLSECPGYNYFIHRYCEFTKIALRDRLLSTSPKWEELFQGNTSRPDYITISPLLTSKWGQYASNDDWDLCAYNYYVIHQDNDCPGCGKCPAGCVAVAMGQIMNYWKHPVFHYGESYEHQYDWCNMADALNYMGSNYVKERNAVARLLRDCGTASGTSYCFLNQCQSFAFPLAARNALVNNFGYSSDANLEFRLDYSNDTWKQMLIDNLLDGHPVFYAAMSGDTNTVYIGGHAFVCDGYDGENDQFHFNFGWNGEPDIYLNINDLIVPQGTHVYTFNNLTEQAIFKIYPDGDSYVDYCNSELSLYDFYHAYYGFAEEGDPMPWGNVPSTATNLYSVPAGMAAPSTWYTIPTGEHSEYIAHNEVVLLPNFHAERGAEFLAKIDPCNGCEERGIQLVGPDGTPSENNGASKTLDRSNPLPYQTTPQDVLYPNPTTGEVNMDITGEVKSIILYNNMGLPVGGWKANEISTQRVSINVERIPSGTYLMVVHETSGAIHSGKFIKQ